MRKLILSLLLFYTYTLNTLAHDLWLEKEGNKLVLYYGHKYPHDKNEHSVKKLKYNPSNVKSVICIDKKGNKREIPFSKKYPVSIEANNCEIIYVIYSSGYWTKTPYGEVNKPKNEVDMAVKSWLSFEIVKRINNWNKTLKKPFINKLEIIPRNNLADINVGDKLRLKVLLNGKPVENAPVYYNGKFRGTTDEEGNINIKIRNKGFQLVEASYDKEINSPKADKVIYTTILNFEINK